MPNLEVVLVAVVFVPAIGSLLLPLVGRFSPRLRNWLGLSLVLCSLAGSLALVKQVISGGTVTVAWSLPLGMDFIMRADGLAVFMAIVSSLISSIIVLYSMGYISHYGNQNEYYLMVVLFLASMMGLVFSGSLVLLYVFWELTAITSWRLIGFFRQKQHVLRADKAFLVTMGGAAAMLLGFVIIYQQTGSLDMAVIKQHVAGTGIPLLAAVLVLMGILSKSATLPLHGWLPDAGVAPSPVTALLHAAVLVKIGVYVFARLFVASIPLQSDVYTAVLIIAAVSMLVSAAAALIETDLKRIIAYSTVSQIGFIFMGFALGSEVGVAGALLYILMHGIAKGGLFLCAGIVEQNAHTKDIRQMGGLAATMPVTAVAFLLCALSVMGIPPFGGFFSKYMVIRGAVEAQGWVAPVFIAGACLTILYLFRVFNRVFLGEAAPQSESAAGAREGSPVMVTCVAALGVLSLVSGLAIALPSEFAQTVARQMLGIAQ
jgi:proton-translocating NADH-quinone oxidoreductase chain N